MSETEAKAKEINFKRADVPHWAAFQPDEASDDEKNEYLRKNLGEGKTITYKQDAGGGDWKCTTCGSDIMCTTVAHTIRDGVFAFSGSGSVHNESVPYCPKCEKPPAFHGRAIPAS
jgi:hypothetical protein